MDLKNPEEQLFVFKDLFEKYKTGETDAIKEFNEFLTTINTDEILKILKIYLLETYEKDINEEKLQKDIDSLIDIINTDVIYHITKNLFFKDEKLKDLLFEWISNKKVIRKLSIASSINTIIMDLY
jgi:hypothetical protein